jgi:hypothetical protein
MSKLGKLLDDKLIELRAARPARRTRTPFDLVVSEQDDDVIATHINRGHFHKVVDFVLDQFDTASEDQEERLLKLSKDLDRAGQTEQVIRLWRGFAAIRQRFYWNSLKLSKKADCLSPFPLLPEGTLVPSKTYGAADLAKVVSELGGIENAARLAVERRQKLALRSMQCLHALMQEAGYTDKAEQVAQEMAAVKAGKKKPVRKDNRKMDTNVFWDLITECQSADRAEDKTDLLSEKLASFNPTAIKEFARLLDACMDESHHWDIWAIAFIARGGCSDDAFDYFKEWVIMQGRHVFESAVAEPLSLVDYLKPDEDPQCEGLLSTPQSAYEEQTSKNLTLRRRKPISIKGKEWKENELALRYPTVFSRLKAEYKR